VYLEAKRGALDRKTIEQIAFAVRMEMRNMRNLSFSLLRSILLDFLLRHLL